MGYKFNLARMRIESTCRRGRDRGLHFRFNISELAGNGRRAAVSRRRQSRQYQLDYHKSGNNNQDNYSRSDPYLAFSHSTPPRIFSATLLTHDNPKGSNYGLQMRVS